MKKLLTILTTAALAAASLTPLASHAIYTETDASSETYQSLIKDSLPLDKSLWMSFFTTGWSAEHYPYDRMYLNVGEDGSARLTAVRNMERIAPLNITVGMSMSDVNAALSKYNAENGTNLVCNTYSYGSQYQYMLRDREKNLTAADVKNAGKLLQEAGLITDLTFMADRCNIENWYATYLTGYEAADNYTPYDTELDGHFEMLEKYVDEQGLDCEVKDMYRYLDGDSYKWREKTADETDNGDQRHLYLVIPNHELTPLEHYRLMLRIMEDVGISPAWGSPTIGNQEANLYVDCLGYVDGDANADGKLDVADAVLIMQSLSNPDKYSLTAQGEFNADIAGDGDGITLSDALAVQEILLGK